eukprot:TRINITY_DN15226_c0_g1_i1.p1 TRINITY_DN15226_c0_g1~~TRINITY_DN15226_c0_g1_i1.p1  ORF type:complete len:279 (+),score=46.21 TRINITY_DN15226_c0_g1_i1:31-867(+)
MAMLLLDFVATSGSSVLANCVTHPFETVKVRQQLKGERGSLSAVTRNMVRSEGYKALYKGFGASVARGVISGGGRQTFYYWLKAGLLKDDNQSATARVALGMIAGILAAGLAAPVDMARTRQQASTEGMTMFRVLKSAYQNEGGFRGLYRGSSAVFARQAVLNGSQLASYDRAKALTEKYFGLPPDSIASMLVSGAIAGGVVTLAVAPVEMIKTQMQIEGASSSNGFSVCMKAIYHDGGIASFWRGSAALWAKLAPHTMIVLLLTDKFREFFGIPIIL